MGRIVKNNRLSILGMESFQVHGKLETQSPRGTFHTFHTFHVHTPVRARVRMFFSRARNNHSPARVGMESMESMAGRPETLGETTFQVPGKSLSGMESSSGTPA